MPKRAKECGTGWCQVQGQASREDAERKALEGVTARLAVDGLQPVGEPRLVWSKSTTWRDQIWWAAKAAQECTT